MRQLKNFLESWDELQLDDLRKILGIKDNKWARTDWDDVPQLLCDELEYKAKNLGEVLVGTKYPYRRICRWIAKKMKVSFSDSTSAPELERRIVREFTSHALCDLQRNHPEEFEVIRDRVYTEARKSGLDGKKVFAAMLGGGLIIGEASGFAIYLAATTALKAVSLLLGITFSFSAYTALTTTLSFVLGPVGWVVASLVAAWGFGRANLRATQAAVIYIAAVRAAPSAGN